MTRKVFISVLGTGFYGKCKYYVKKDNKEEFSSDETRFIQSATLEYLKTSEWNKNDIGLFLLTKKAKEYNWDKSNSKRENFKKETEEYIRLEKVLEDMNLPFQIKPVDISDGNNEEQIWEIFKTTYKELQEGDELYIDITHAFRSLPMLMLVLCNYSKFLKNTTVKSITYGNYEAREDNKAPIIDLFPLAQLQDWTYAAGTYLENGNATGLVNLCEENCEPILKETQGQDKNAKNLRNFAKNLNKIVDERNYCRGMEIIKSESMKKISQAASELETTFIEAFNPLFEKIKASLKDFDENYNVNNALSAAKWCFENRLYQQSATILQEYVVSFFCQRHSIEIDKEDKRELVNKAFTIKFYNNAEDNWGVSTDEEKEKIREILSDRYFRQKKLIEDFNNLTEVRNDYNHSGMRSRRKPMSAKNIKDNIGKCLKNFEEILRPKPLLINLSNHPVEKWSDEQKETALNQFGGIIDLQFPAVQPDCSEEEIHELAQTYLQKVEEIAANRDAIVHIMGEMTLTFALISLLQTNGFNCIASTTTREVKNLPNGIKESVFKFSRFRKYENIN